MLCVCIVKHCKGFHLAPNRFLKRKKKEKYCNLSVSKNDEGMDFSSVKYTILDTLDNNDFIAFPIKTYVLDTKE